MRALGKDHSPHQAEAQVEVWMQQRAVTASAPVIVPRAYWLYSQELPKKVSRYILARAQQPLQ